MRLFGAVVCYVHCVTCVQYERRRGEQEQGSEVTYGMRGGIAGRFDGRREGGWLEK